MTTKASAEFPRRFALVRSDDPTGISGTGIVALGVQFDHGPVVIQWISQHPSTAIWNSIEDVLAVHGHQGRTRIAWLDEQQPRPGAGRHRADNNQPWPS